MFKQTFLKKRLLSLSLIFFTSSFSFTSEWSYSGKTSPEHWGQLSPEFAKAIGDKQSPISIDLKKYNTLIKKI